MSIRQFEGSYNLETGETQRTAIMLHASSGSILVEGPEDEVDRTYEELEAWGESFEWIEASVPLVPAIPPLNPRTPAEIGSARITREDFQQNGILPARFSRLLTNLGYLGIDTYGDVLALGSEALMAQSRSAFNSTIGEGRLKCLRSVISARTGYELPTHRASPEELVRYFDDITGASIALGLPYGIFTYVAKTELPFDLRTIGSVIGLSRAVLAERLIADKRRVDIDALGCFIQFLREEVVVPFDHAKIRAEPTVNLF